MDLKSYLIDALKDRYQIWIAEARKAEVQSAETADAIKKEARRKEDSKSAVEFGRRALEHQTRRARAVRELEILLQFTAGGIRHFSSQAKIEVGALVDVSVEGEAEGEQRTIFLRPVAAGTRLSGPDGDGIITIITPESPVGRALMGAVMGDHFEIVIAGEDTGWTVEFVS